jgi:hypothetical protein
VSRRGAWRMNDFAADLAGKAAVDLYGGLPAN